MALAGNGRFSMYPNPNNGDHLSLNITSVETGVHKVEVDIYDLTGKRIVTRTIAVMEGYVSTTVDLHELNSGLYMVHITSGAASFTERLVIQK